MMTTTSKMLGLAALLSTALFVACAMPAFQIKSLDDLSATEAVLVGRIEFHPPLLEGEQHLVVTSSTLTAKSFRDKFYVIAGDKPENIKLRVGELDKYSLSQFKNTHETYLQRDFYLKADTRSPFIISGGFFYAAMTPKIHEVRFLRIPLKIDIRPGDKAIYIGTIQYHRDEFFRGMVVIKNDFSRTNEEFIKKFGPTYKLVERLAKKI